MQFVGQKAQRGTNPFANLGGFAKAAAVADAEAGQAETGGSDAGHGTIVVTRGKGAILHLSRFGAGFKPEEIEAEALNLIEQLLIGALIRGTLRCNEGFLGRSLRKRQ